MSDLLHPYNYSQCNELMYEFTTIHGDVYVAYFIDMAVYSPHFNNVYTFNFESRNEVNSPQDERIADTICSIVGTIFEDNKNAVIIICDNTDNREQGRNRLFQQWYSRINNTSICKVDKQYHSEDYDIYSSLLIHADNPDLGNIVEAFVKLAEKGFIPDED